MDDRSEQAQKDALDAEIRETEVLSRLPENANRVFAIRVTARKGEIVTAYFRQGVCIGITYQAKEQP